MSINNTNNAAPETGIPIVDFSKFLNGEKEEKEFVARQIDDAFRNAGFVYLKGHGVPKETVEECFEWNKSFFALPPSTKNLAPHPPGSTWHRGYSSPGLEKVTQHIYDNAEIHTARQTPDYKESFESGNISDASQPNIWLPEDTLPGFRCFMEAYFVRCADLVHSILDALSIALDVPAPGLRATHAQSLFQLRLLHYPTMSREELTQGTGRARINAHSDFGTLTLLFQDSVGGLEIEDPHHAGVFRPVEPLDGCVLVNVGDLMARWSNERWRSSVHRVGLPAAFKEGREEGEFDGDGLVPDRYSIPFFATADPDQVIDVLPGCWDEKARPKKFEPVTAAGYVQMRMAALY